MRAVIWWATNFVALFVAAQVARGIDYGDIWALLLAALVFGLVNLVVRPLVVLLALPAVILTLGIALLAINALMLYLTDWIVPGFEVEGFWWAVLGAVIVWVVNMILHSLIPPERPRRRELHA